MKDSEKSVYVRRMFGRIAENYDLLNRLMTFGQDRKWRTEAISHLSPTSPGWYLDLGAGTGDIACEIARDHPNAKIIASDLTPEMVYVGKKRIDCNNMTWVIADAQHLPFARNAAEGVISGYLLRNVPDVDTAVKEQMRVLRPGGSIVSLDTTPPPDNLFKPFIQFHLHRIIPFLGKIIAGDSEAYTYLPDSTEHFLSAECLAEKFQSAGFEGVHFVRRMFATMAIHWGRKPVEN